MSIFDVRHQPRAQRLVQRALACERLPHAYVFHGPEGVGRELFAGRLARLLLCPDPTTTATVDTEGFESWANPVVDACHQCESCKAVANAAHPDVHLIQRELIRQHPDPVVRARKGIGLGIDVVRTFLIDRVANKPILGRAKVFIVREADRMNVAAQNALLKTLEEPPDTTFLILIVASLDMMLPTVRSRCQIIPFGPLPSDFIMQQLRQRNPELTDEEAMVCVTYANGSLGAGQRHFDDRLAGYNARVLGLADSLPRVAVSEAAKELIAGAKELGGAYQKRDEDISDTEAQRIGLKSLLSLLANRYRDVLHVSVGGSKGQGEGKARASLAPSDAAKAIRAIVTAERQLDLNANAQLCIETLLIRLSRLPAG